MMLLSVCIFIVLLGIGEFRAAADDCELTKHDSMQRAKIYLEKLKPLHGKTFSTSDQKYQYFYSVCSTPDHGTGHNECSDNTKAGGYQIENKECTVTGRYNETEIIGGNDWILLKYMGGEKYTTHCNKNPRQMLTMITCDMDADGDGSLILIEENSEKYEDCYYLFELKTNLICPKYGLSAGSVFCIIFFTGVGIYLFVGFLYSRFIVGAKGLEQIPNYSFWKDFGKLESDGCNFLCRCGERQEAKMYRGIGDTEDKSHSSQDRDDHLLPM